MCPYLDSSGGHGRGVLVLVAVVVAVLAAAAAGAHDEGRQLVGVVVLLVVEHHVDRVRGEQQARARGQVGV